MSDVYTAKEYNLFTITLVYICILSCRDYYCAGIIMYNSVYFLSFRDSSGVCSVGSDDCTRSIWSQR